MCPCYMLEHMPSSGVAGHSGKTISYFRRNNQIDFQSGFCQLSIPPSMEECSFLCTVWLSSAVTSEVESHGSFDLHFPDD